MLRADLMLMVGTGVVVAAADAVAAVRFVVPYTGLPVVRVEG